VSALAWDGCTNVRDLGGLPTEDGRSTRFRSVVRADNIRALSTAGWHALVDYGVRRIVDLRFPEELADVAPGDAPVEVVHVSLLGGSRTAEWQAEQNAALDAAQNAHDYLVPAYRGFLERYRTRFATAVRAVAEAPAGAVLLHCMGGKDRTGLVTALILRAVGVPAAAVASDYALTEAALAPSAEEWVAAAPDEAERRRRVLLQPAPAETMLDVLSWLDRRHAGAAAYLRRGGLGDAALRSLERRLVGP
jgi:protein tyrosine/serine phosphatase